MELDIPTLRKIQEFFTEMVWEGVTKDWAFVSKDGGRMAIATRADWVLRNMGEKDPQVNDREDKHIKSLKEMGFSIAQIAYICDRSKSTVHAHLS